MRGIPLPPRPLAALTALVDRLAPARVEWLLAGSAARALQGFAVRPADLDLEVSARDAEAASAALGLELGRDAGRGCSSLRARGIVARSRIDLTCDLEVTGPGGRLRPDFGRQRAWATPIEAAGRTVLVAPLEEAIARALVLGDWSALARIAAQAAAGPGRAPAPRAGYLAARLSSATESATR